MNRRELGRTGLPVSEIGFGCWAIGGSGYGPTRDEDSLLALETAWEKGVNFFDTADTYGDGHSERLLSRFLRGKPRDQIYVASKVGWDFYGEGGSKKNFDPGYIEFACEESLKRLRTDYIDVCQLHNPKLDVIEKGDALEALEKLKEEGKIRFIGISIHREDEAFAALTSGKVDTLQLVFNLIDQRFAAKVFPEAKVRNIGVIVREPLACGLLTGKYHSQHEFAKTDHRRRWTREKLDIDLSKIEKIKEVLTTDRVSLTQAALEYVLDHDAVSTVIPGAKTRAQVRENVKASLEPGLRIQESSHLRDLYQRENIFQEGESPK